MKKEEIVKELLQEQKAMEIAKRLRESSPKFMEWLDFMLRPFEQHSRWIQRQMVKNYE